MTSPIRIGKREIGPGAPLFLMAEVGVTCNYDMTLSRELIDAARTAGADAVKFIFWFPDEIMSDRSVVYEYDTVDGRRAENMYEMLNRLRFSLDQWRELKAYADARDVVFFATVNSPSGIAWAETLGLAAYKLSSWDYNDLPLWRRIAALGKPMLIDTGPVTTLDVAKVMDVVRAAGNDRHVLIHCPHAETAAEMNLRSLPYMARAFRTLVGYSSKDRAPEPDIAAVALGAVALEKRLTMSRRLPGHHHVISLEPGELADWVRMIREVQVSLGVEDLRPSQADLRERQKWFRHVVASRDIRKGTRLTADMLASKRPASGISPEHLDLLVGRVVQRDLRENEAVRWDDV
jgi:sialic acid synthase SpsE